MESFRKAVGVLKDSTTVGLAKVNSDFKDLDIAIVKATNHVECPPKERHIRKIFAATSAIRPRADVAYCIHALSRRLAKTRNWIVAIKTLIVIHRTLREGDPTFKEELLNYSNRNHVLQISNFKDESSPIAWDCSAWVRTYALFLEERLECFRILGYDIESERLTKVPHGGTKVHSRTRLSSSDELLEQLPGLQQLLYRLVGCQPEGAGFNNYLIQFALALVLKESFKIYCAINDGIINLVDMFFDMSRHDAVRALNIYKRAGQQAEHLAHFYEICKGLDLARHFQFPTLRQPPPSFLATMEEYIKEAPHSGSVSSSRLEYQEREPPPPQKLEEPTQSDGSQTEEEVDEKEQQFETVNEPEPKPEVESPTLIPASDTADLLGMNETDPRALELEESNAMALAIVPGNDSESSTNHGLDVFGSSGWELALVNKPTSNNSQSTGSKLAGGFDRLLLDSLYEDDNARRQLQMQNAGYGYNNVAPENPFDQQDPFLMSNSIAPPTGVQMAIMAQQQQQQQQQQMMFYPPQQQNLHQTQIVPHNHLPQHPQQPWQEPGTSNPFGDPFFSPPPSGNPPPQGNHSLL